MFFHDSSTFKLEYKADKGFKELLYQPPMQRHKFQMSLWRVDEFGMAKTIYTYFTPENAKFKNTEDLNISFVKSHDKSHFVVCFKEKKGYYMNLIVFDSYSLDILSEHELQYKILALNEESDDMSSDDSYGDEDDENKRRVYVVPKAPEMISFSHAKYVL